MPCEIIRNGKITTSGPSLFIKGCFFDDRTNAEASGTSWEAFMVGSRLCLISESVSSSHATEPDITGRSSTRLQSKL